MATLTRRQYRGAAQERREFKGNSVFAEWSGSTYVVYSYGRHWPLFAWIDGVWYGNTDKYSVTTSHHYGYCHPHAPVVGKSAEELLALLLRLAR